MYECTINGRYMWLIYHIHIWLVNLLVNFVDPWTQECTIFTGANHQKITIYDRKVWSHQNQHAKLNQRCCYGSSCHRHFWRIISKIKQTSQNSQKQKFQHLSIFWQVVKHNYLHIVCLKGRKVHTEPSQKTYIITLEVVATIKTQWWFLLDDDKPLRH